MEAVESDDAEDEEGDAEGDAEGDVEGDKEGDAEESAPKKPAPRAKKLRKLHQQAECKLSQIPQRTCHILASCRMWILRCITGRQSS